MNVVFKRVMGNMYVHVLAFPLVQRAG